MDKANWKALAIANMVMTIISLTALVFVSLSFRSVIRDMNKNESSRTRIEVKYISKTIDDVEFIFPSSGIIRDTETNDDMVIDKFDIIEIIQSDDEYDTYSFEVAGTNYSSDTLNIYFAEYDSEGYCIEEYQSQLKIVKGERGNKKSSVAINKKASRIIIRFQEDAEINFD